MILVEMWLQGSDGHNERLASQIDIMLLQLSGRQASLFLGYEGPPTLSQVSFLVERY